MKLLELITLILIICLSSLLYPQENNWKLTLNNGSEITEIQIDSLNGNSFAFKRVGQSELIEVESIAEIRKVNDPNPWLWQGGGFLIGATAFLVAASVSSSDEKSMGSETAGALLGGVIVGLLGALIGWGISEIIITDDVYDLNGLPLNDKLSIVATIPLN